MASEGYPPVLRPGRLYLLATSVARPFGKVASPFLGLCLEGKGVQCDQVTMDIRQASVHSGRFASLAGWSRSSLNSVFTRNWRASRLIMRGVLRERYTSLGEVLQAALSELNPAVELEWRKRSTCIRANRRSTLTKEASTALTKLAD